MPIITLVSVQEKNKNRCNLFIDGEFRTGLLLETAIKFGLKKGKEIDEKSLLALLSENEKKEAVVAATDYATRGLKTKKQVKDNLVKKGYSLDSAYYAIDKLKSYGLIDDVNYARRFIESAGKNQGKKLIAYKLMNKGIKKEDIETAFDGAIYSGEESAVFVLEKYMKNKERTKENKVKAYRFLAGKGFSYEEINSALNGIFGDD